MIKNLKLKLLISMFLLVTVFSVTSSCFASSVEEYTYKDFSIKMDKTNKTLYVLNNVSNKSDTYDISYGLDNYSNYYFQVNNNNQYPSLYSECYNFGLVFSNSFSWKSNTYNNITTYSYCSANSYCYYFDFRNNEYSLPWGETCGFAETASNCASRGDNQLQLDSDYNYKYSDTQILTSSDVINKPDGSLLYKAKKVTATYEFQVDTSAKVRFEYDSSKYSLQYSLTGVEPNVSLTEPVKLRNAVDYIPGVTNLVVRSNSKVYYALYDSSGSCVEQSVLEIPTYDDVKANSDKDITTEIEYNSDNTEATLYASITNGEFSDKLYYSFYPPNIKNEYEAKIGFPRSGLKVTKNCDIYLIATDAFDNIITCDYVTINKLGIIPENLFKVNVDVEEEKTVKLYPRLYGLDTDKYYIEVSSKLDNFTSSDNISFYINNDKKGNVKDLNEKYFEVGSDAELKYYQNIGTSNITVTFLVKNVETDAICITRTVSFKIGLNSSETGITDSTTNGVYDDSFIFSDSSDVVNSIEKMKLQDYYNLVDTGNSAWYFFKVILNNLPRWITLPLSLLIFGVVIITLYRFIRGA